MDQNNLAMEVANDTENMVELLANDIIYVERHGRQTEHSTKEAFETAGKLAAQLREQGKPVLVLNHAHGETVSAQVITKLLHFDFDRVAVYGTSQRLNNLRDLMARANGLDGKIASFQTEAEALAWLRSV